MRRAALTVTSTWLFWNTGVFCPNSINAKAPDRSGSCSRVILSTGVSN